VVIPDSSLKTMNQTVSANANPSTIIKSDGCRGF
jgi:hypothetical protein